VFTLSQEAKKFLSASKGRKVVFTNGCFDILHAGHISYLNDAKRCGDVLFIGLNSDESVGRLKGKDRPVNDQVARKFLLENLKSVDFVEIFDEDTPLELIRAVRPDVLVKGGDWKVPEIVGSEFVIANGGEVKSLHFVEGLSTTEFIHSLQGRK
jgi:rfaE bifunctional protein nucleotidyltransferase chain/domain